MPGPLAHHGASFCAQAGTCQQDVVYVLGHNYAAYTGVVICFLMLAIWIRECAQPHPEEID